MPSPAEVPAPGWGARLRRRIVLGGRRDGRLLRYAVAFLLWLGLIWGLAAAYLLVVPRSYTAAFVFVLPGTGAGSSLNLESIGQAVSTSASAFSSPDFSPTQNYRRMLLSRRVLNDTAARLGMPEDSFPTPRVDLADQAKLISISVVAREPQLAQARAEALQETFLAILNELRREEIETRDLAYRDTMRGYQDRLDRSRQALIAHQGETGLVSLDQYGTIVAAVERLREQLREVNARLAQARAGSDRLVEVLGASPDLANSALLLRADPIAQELLGLLARQEAELSTLTGIRAAGNPRVQDLGAERASTLRRLAERVAEVGEDRPMKSPKRALEVTRRSVSTSRRSPVLAKVLATVMVGRSTRWSEAQPCNAFTKVLIRPWLASGG